MGNSTDLQQEVLEELRWEPFLLSDQIGVIASEPGFVTLTGTVASYGEKLTAERAARRVRGIQAVTNDIEVPLHGPMKHTDTDLTNAVLRALEWDIAVPDENVRVQVERGWVTLEGEVAFQLQRAAADHAVRRLTGIRGITNRIRLQGSSSMQLN
jgi:osmotically-inducible protein OsmY